MTSDRLRILAFSDLHGLHYREAEGLIARHAPDWIVLAGDVLPDFGMISGRQSRLEAQRLHWQAWRSSFLREGATTTFVLGNHEIEGFLDPNLRSVPASLVGKVGFLEGIPAEFGAWGFSREWGDEALQAELDGLGAVDILISHVPPFGLLDRAAQGEHIGHRPLSDRLQSGRPPRLVISGHVHESFGVRPEGRCLILNVACGYALLEWDFASRSARLLSMTRLQSVRGEASLEEG